MEDIGLVKLLERINNIMKKISKSNFIYLNINSILFIVYLIIEYYDRLDIYSGIALIFSTYLITFIVGYICYIVIWPIIAKRVLKWEEVKND